MHKRLIVKIMVQALLMTPALTWAKSIAIIDSYHKSYPWVMAERTGFEEVINPLHDLTYYEMDTKRIDQSLFQDKADEIWLQISDENPDLVVTMDDNALKYLGQRVVNAGYPLVFMGVNNDPRHYFEGKQLPEKVAGILERPPIKQNLKFISQLVPIKNQRILIMLDSGTTSASIKAYALSDQSDTSFDGIDLEVFMADNLQAWKEKVSGLSPDSYDALVIGSYAGLKDKNQVQVPDELLAKWTSSNSTIPLFTFWDHGAGKGKAIGGIVVSGFFQGTNAAEVANEIMSTGKIPYVEIPEIGELILSEYELARWGIDLPYFIRKRSVIVE